jgi:hypothetical protein
MSFWLLLLLLIQMTKASSYLSNTYLSVNYTDIPTTNFLNLQYSNPYVAFGCSTADDKNNLYLISSSYHYPIRYTGNEAQRCVRTTKYVEIVKYNKTSSNFEGTLLIGKKTSTYSNAVGNLGSDHIVFMWL